MKDRQPYSLRLAAALLACWLPALLDPGSVGRAAALFPAAGLAGPYFVPGHALLLYLWTPMVVGSACILLLSPGLLLALALRTAGSLERWLLSGLALSLVVVSFAAAVAQGTLGAPLIGRPFAIVVALTAAACGCFLWTRLRRGQTAEQPLAEPGAAARLALIIAVPLLLLIVLAPKFHWENFNGDGVHAYESARLLLFQALPFWPADSGEIAGFPGSTSFLFAYPTSWFIRLFGETEASGRLPHLLYVAVLQAGLLALVRHGRDKAPAPAVAALVGLALAVYSLVMAFSATYNPYAADITLPATQDTLLVICFLGFVLAVLRSEAAWSFFYTLLVFVAQPSGVLLVAFFWMAVIIAWRPLPWDHLRRGAIHFVICLGLLVVLPRLLLLLGWPAPGGEYGLLGLAARFAFLQFTHLARFAFVAVPCGILPALALLAWKRQDRVSRLLTLVTLIYFVFFYVQAYISLHHFVPAMLLPLVVLWRTVPALPPRQQRLAPAAAGIAATLALVLSLPATAAPDISGRQVGAAIEDRLGGYDRQDPAVYRRAVLLQRLFPPGWDPRVPDDEYGGSPLVWIQYAHRAGGPEKGSYLLQADAETAPPGMRLLASEAGVSLYVAANGTWERHRALRPPTPAGSRLYALPRGLLFRSVPLADGPYIVDVPALLQRMGVDTEGLMDRLGVER